MPKCVFQTSTIGQGNILVGNSFLGFEAFANAVANNSTFFYEVNEFPNWEQGQGFYNGALNVMTRQPTDSSSGGAPISLSGNAVVIVSQSATRKLVPPNGIVIYVDPVNGSDGNNGLSPVGAFQTIQAAYNFLAGQYDFNGNVGFIQLLAGTYNSGLNITLPWVGGGGLAIQGDINNPNNMSFITGGACFTVSCALSGVVNISGVRVKSTGGDGFVVLAPATMNLNAIVYDSCAGFHNHSFGGGALIKFAGNMTIVGGSTSFLLAHLQGCVQCDNITVTVFNNPAITLFTFATRLGAIEVTGVTWQDQNSHIRQTATGNLNSNTTITNLSINTNLLSVGMPVVDFTNTAHLSGIPTITSIVNSTAVAISNTANATATGDTLKFEIATGTKFLNDTGGITYTLGGSGQGFDYLPGTANGTSSAVQYT